MCHPRDYKLIKTWSFTALLSSWPELLVTFLAGDTKQSFRITREES
jgi:hypothetical protein